MLEWRPEDGAHETEAVKWRHATEACSPGPPQAMPLGLIGSYGHHLRRPAAKKDARGERARGQRRIRLSKKPINISQLGRYLSTHLSSHHSLFPRPRRSSPSPFFSEAIGAPRRGQVRQLQGLCPRPSTASATSTCMSLINATVVADSFDWPVKGAAIRPAKIQAQCMMGFLHHWLPRMGLPDRWQPSCCPARSCCTTAYSHCSYG